MAVFEIYDDQDPRQVEIDQSRLTIGRTGENAVIIEDRSASRVHCEIRCEQGEFVLRDLQSRNGTRVNQNQVIDSVILVDGDEILIGEATIRFWSGPDKVSGSTIRKLPKNHQPPGQRKPSRTGPQKRPSPEKAPSRKENRTASAPSGKDSKEPSRIALIDADLFDESGDASKPKAASLQSPPERYQKAKPASQLTLNDIMPLNADGQYAHARKEDASEVSTAMLRLKQILLRAFQFAATDIHIEPKEKEIQLRYRIDGSLHAGGRLDAQVTRSVLSIVKLLCNLDISKKGIMQDGSFAVRLPDRRVDLRISLAPTTQGDKLVIRVLDKTLAPSGLNSLGMDGTILQEFRRYALQESSMMVVCGPTGSGKTTTVYALLQDISRSDRNIVTVEDPVEYKLEDITQIQVNPKMGITFSSALKSLLRQDPDIILIGEMRDEETAQMAVQSAMTGHLVLSTLHARDSIGSIFRLLDLGVEPFLLGSALTAVLSQRLLRKLCTKCKMKMQPAIRRLTELGLEELTRHTLYNPVGCDHCMEIGYHGRLPIFEMLVVTDQVREAIAHRPTIQQLRVAAGDWIFQTLREDAIRKIRSGVTSLEEFKIVAGREGG